MFGKREPIARSRTTTSKRSHAAATSSNQLARHTTASLQWLTVLLALLASFIFVLADADRSKSSASLWIQMIFEVSATLGFTWLAHRRIAKRNEQPLIIPLLLFVVLLSLVWEPFQRWFFQTGRPFETMVMNSQKTLMLATAVFGYRVAYQRLSVIIGVALAIFCAAISAEHRVHWLIAIYGFAVLSWMIASHWDTLRSRLIAGETRRLPLRWLIIGPSIPLLMLLASADGGNRAMTAMRGFLPGSGGEGESDPFSRGGVNDGENLVAGTDNIKSFGPIEDAPFAEDDKPSLYDIFNDSFDEPARKIKDQDRSIALPPQTLADVKARMAKSEQAGREFSTLRKSTRPDQKKIKDLESRALLYVAGRVPLHLRMETYDIFDGIDWIAETLSDEPRELSMVSSNGRPWLRVPRSSRALEFFVGHETHAIKVINLRTNVIPAPLHFRGLHIDKVDQIDMFSWYGDTILKMNRKSLPEFTAIHLQSECIDHSMLRDHDDLTFQALSDIKRTQLPELRQMAEVRSLAEKWTQGIPHGYRQIEAICQQLRTSYTVDRSAHAPEDCPFPVGHFLFESKRGASYHFATAATMMLRSLGYSTRLVSGFYANPERFDVAKGHTAVHSSDTHFWCEVYVGAGTWVTLEPTPGYEVLTPPPGLLRRTLMFAADCAQWMLRHWMFVSITSVVFVMAFINRYRLADLGSTQKWRLFPARSSRGRVIQTMRLLERRFRFAGLARPSGVTFTTWFRRQQPRIETCPETPLAVNEFLQLADWAVYGVDDLKTAMIAAEVETACGKFIRLFTLEKLQNSATKSRQATAAPSASLNALNSNTSNPEIAYS
ncbi:MAG: transglutaminase domain-containing protein [Planctomycetota bacterium]|nr:MAG: transglutaminase domain-containing protein [Planctomycetota bacterium]